MNKLTVSILAIILVISVCANIYLWRHTQNIHGEQKEAITVQEEYTAQLDTVERKLVAAYEKIEELKDARDALDAQLIESITPMTAVGAELDAETHSIMESAKAGNEDVFSAGTNDTNATKNFMTGVSEMMNDPQMREMIRSQVKNMQLDTLYNSLFSGLQLDAEDEEVLRELLTDEILIGLEMMQLVNNPDTADSVDEIIQEKKDALNEEMKELLGEEKYEELEEYRSSLQERAVVGQLNQQLVMSGSTPLSPTQQDSLIDIMTEERNNVELDGTHMNLQDATMSEINELDTDDFLRRQVEIHQRVRERADTLLSSDQMKSLERFQDMYLQQIRMGLQMSKSMMPKDKKAE